MAAMEGPLSKWTNVMKGWQYRWFVLDPQTGLLSYYTSKEKMMRGSRRGCVRLQGALIGIDDEDDSTFTITCDQKTFHFQARDAEERKKWVNSLEETIVRHSQPRWYDSIPDYTLTLEDFDKKLVEADAYLQILIEQESQLTAKIEKCEDEEQKQKYQRLKTSATDLLESIKQSIVLLQLAKCVLSQNAVNPMNGVIQLESYPENNGYGEKSATKSKSSASGSSNSIEEAVECIEDIKIGESVNTSVIPDVSVQTPGADAVTSPITMQTSMKTSPPVSPTRVTHLSAPVPALSYSSSDEEDSFYDADEYLMYEDSGQWDSARDSPTPDIDTKNVVVKSPDPITASQMYEEEEEEEELDCGKHGSIITHLLSQVRIGMDLTKVVLPTFILERRSLLEMFADFFAHPDLFSSIPDYEDPKDRIVQVTKWFLSAFHAGKKGSVAKKPYNPIIGETFQCLYDFSEGSPEHKEQKQEDLVPDGPVPWATKDNVAVLAEQVSHHPPISAFYAENYNKGVSLNAHIWTKSKFLGLSIGVEMIGQGVVSDLKHDEEYIVTFPNGYGRSILTVPWFEMGGKCSISCAKTGFGATVVFHTKPFYGGSKHRITAEVSHVSDRKPFLTITGEWNGVMTSKWANGQTETFIDTYMMKTYKKKVRPVDQQGEFESRRLWKDVTYNLKMKNMDAATAGKHKLEERQRAERKQRQETGTKWMTKHFYEDGDNYIYKRHLQKRLEEKLEQAQREREQALKDKELQLQQQRQAELIEQQKQLQLQQEQLQLQQAQLATQLSQSQPPRPKTPVNLQTVPTQAQSQVPQQPLQNQLVPTAAEMQPSMPEQSVSASMQQETGLPARTSQLQPAQKEIQDLLG